MGDRTVQISAPRQPEYMLTPIKRARTARKMMILHIVMLEREHIRCGNPSCSICSSFCSRWNRLFMGYYQPNLLVGMSCWTLQLIEKRYCPFCVWTIVVNHISRDNTHTHTHSLSSYLFLSYSPCNYGPNLQSTHPFTKSNHFTHPLNNKVALDWSLGQERG